MNKSNLKTGMVVETKNKLKFVVLKDCVENNICESCIFKADAVYMPASKFTEDLICIDRPQLRIDKVYAPLGVTKILDSNPLSYYLIWRRPEKFSLTPLEYELLMFYRKDNYIHRNEHDDVFIASTQKANDPDEVIDWLSDALSTDLFKFIPKEGSMKIEDVLADGKVMKENKKRESGNE